MTLHKIYKKIIVRINDLFYQLGINRDKDVLVYLGVNHGQGLSSIFRNYKKCYAFEANPEIHKLVSKRFKKYKDVTIINAAVSKEEGEIEFNISNNGVSSSIGSFDENWTNKEVKMIKKIKVKSINLLNFLESKNITFIDDYHSDIQGYDLEVLKTIKPFIDAKKIGAITSEVAKDKYRNIYADLPDNNESAFNDLLSENYTLVSKGEGILIEGEFKEVPDSWWEMDCMWKLKQN